MKINFNDPQEFENLENRAIDGQLDYENFPPIEYKYFSKLSKLGYYNRHNGWDKDICLAKQEEYRKTYHSEKEEAERFLTLSKHIQENIKRAFDLKRKCYFAKSKEEIFQSVLEIAENLTGENGFKERMNKKINQLIEQEE